MKGPLLNIWRHRFLEFYILMKGLLLNIKSIGGYLDTTYLSLDCNECIQITMTCREFFTKKTIEEFLKHEEEANFNSNTYASSSYAINVLKFHSLARNDFLEKNSLKTTEEVHLQVFTKFILF